MASPAARALYRFVFTGAFMAHDQPDPYVVLGVSPTATPSQITHAYRTQLRAHHPDTRHGPTPQADENLRKLLAAYALLRDPSRRSAYDRTVTPTGTETSDSRLLDRVQIPITYGSTDSLPVPSAGPPLRAGPVRRHR